MFNKDYHNIKPRAVKCIVCQVVRVTDEPNPKCDRCNWSMATILKFMNPDKEELPKEENK